MLFYQHSLKTYDAQEAAKRTKALTDIIREKLKGEIHSSEKMKQILNKNSFQLYDVEFQVISYVTLVLSFRR